MSSLFIHCDAPLQLSLHSPTSGSPVGALRNLYFGVVVVPLPLPCTLYLGILETFLTMGCQGTLGDLQNSDLAHNWVNLEVA